MPEYSDTIHASVDSLASNQQPLDVASPILHLSHIDDNMAYIAQEQNQYVTGRQPYTEGIVPQPRPMLPGYDSAVVCLLLGIFVFVAVNFKHYSVFLKSLAQKLISVRRRDNVFDEHTVNETRIMLSLVTVVCFSEAVLLFSLAFYSGMTMSVFPVLITLFGVTIAYYVMQLIAYSTIGYVFADREQSSQWIKGFNASQALLGIVIVIPSLITLFYPTLSLYMFTIGASCYIASRIVFICKGFKIFYHNFFSLIYFILYLCALELAPLFVIYRLRYLMTSL